MSALQYLADATRMLNEAKPFVTVRYVDISNQIRLVQEELAETEEAFQKDNHKELLDGTVDVIVTAVGLLQMLEKAGFNTDRALRRVADNNLTKLLPDAWTAIKTVSFYKEVQGLETRVVKSRDQDHYAVLDKNDKIKKPIGYTSVNLSDCVPIGDPFTE